jgi:hypothetical protein
MQNQFTVFSSVLPSCAQQYPSRRHHHQCTRPQPPHHPSASPVRVGVGAISGSNAAWPSVGCSGCRGGDVHVCALMKGVGSVKGYWYYWTGSSAMETAPEQVSAQQFRGAGASPLLAALHVTEMTH